MAQWHNWQLHLNYHHLWWLVLHLKCVTRILFNPKKHFKIGSCSKVHIHLKRELSHETRLPEINPTTKNMLCDTVSCQYRWVQLQTLAKMTSSPCSSCGQTWSNVVLQVPPIVSTQTCVVTFQWKRQPQLGSPFWILVDCSKENPSYSSAQTHFFPHWKSCSAHTWIPKSLLIWCHHLIHCLTCTVFMHPNTCYQTLLNGLTTHNCHSHLYTTHY